MDADDDLLGDFLEAAGIGISGSREGSPESSSSATKPAAKKRKNPPKAAASKTKRRKASYFPIKLRLM
jgi:hypothetical protein